MSKFKVNDRVAAYSCFRTTGTIVFIDEKGDGRITIIEDGFYSAQDEWYHPKQCRRLVKKRPEWVKRFLARWKT